MKNTILKMAGTKDEKSFYKKYPTEAAFLKAHPKAKAQLKKFATGGQMNFQTMPQFASGGSIFKDIGAGLYGVGEGLLDTVTLGATDQLTDMGYKALQKAGGSTEDEIREQDSIHGYSQAAGAIGGAVINPAGTGAAIGQTGKGLGEGISRGNESEKWAQDAGKVLNFAGNIGGMAYGNFGSAGGAGALQSAKFAGSDFGKFSNSFGKYGNMAGQTAGFLQPMFNQRHAMGGMQQYAMGGFGNPKNLQASMGVNPNNPQISMSINKVNTNPYESSPAYKAAQAANFYSTGTLYSPGAAKGMTISELVRQHNAASKMPGYEEFGNLKYLSGNINQGTSLFEKTVNGKKSNYYYGKNKDGAFGFFPEVKTQVNNTQVNPQVNPQINPVNNIQNTTQANTQPENRGEYTKFGQPYISVKFKGAHGYSGNDVTYKYYDPITKKEINQDLSKSFDPKGNFVPSFLEQQSNTNNIPVSTNKYGGLMQYAMGGTQYANGGTGEINAEVEGGGYNQNGYNQDGENAIGPNGEFTQFSGPTHAQGGIKTDMAPGTMIFSDKLKMPGSKKSFAALNKLYDTNKEDDVLSSEKSNNTLKLTAMLMRDAKLKQSLALFQEQEQFKQDKVAAYAKRMGVQIPSQDNEQMEPQGMPEQSEGEMAMAMHGGMMNYMAKGGIQESDYQTDPGNLPSLLRQKRANDAALLGIRSSFGPKDDTNNVKDNLVVTLNKAKDFQKELTNKINNHPEFKKAMGGKLPMYQDGTITGATKKIDVNAGSPGGMGNSGDGNSSSGFDWANAGKQVGQFALQNVGNLYDLGRSTQDNSQLSLSRMTPTFLDKTSDLATNQRMYSEGIRDSNAVAQGNPNTWANDRAANRATKLNNDLRINTTYGNLNAEIDNTAKLYNAGAIDRETMFKLQSEAANRNLQGESLGKIGQNIMNQNVTNDKNSMDQKTLDIFRNNINDPTFLKYLSNFKTGTV